MHLDSNLSMHQYSHRCVVVVSVLISLFNPTNVQCSYRIVEQHKQRDKKGG
jgi:hypothetical protein